LLSVRGDLDVPGETGRQARVFAVWGLCLALAILAGSLAGAHVPLSAEGTAWAEQEFARGRANRAKVALGVGLLLPALLTWGIHIHYRRGGGHARGIKVDITEAGELRIWGRGYGSRLALPGAAVSERLVDVYAGRLGAWRQRRLKVRSGRTTGGGTLEMEIATMATAADLEDGLRVEGGEGTSVEVCREDYERIREWVLKMAGKVRSEG
jgi:hypothetical protein